MSEFNLGRATRRGVKKCPKCGIYNGTRGMICKNKLCDAVFKDYVDKTKICLDAVRLHGIVRQIYSVRVGIRAPDHRGFVQLPRSGDASVLSENALCFVDSCQRLFDDSFLKYHELEENASSLLCVHIDSAIRSQSIGTPINIKKDIINDLKTSKEIKADLWLLASEKEGPLVQRVSRTVMVVKCQVTPKHPLGYLHFAFCCTKGRDIYNKYYCSCTEFRVSDTITFKCIHYYACICALASDQKLSDEFSYFLNYEFPKNTTLEEKTCDQSTNVNSMGLTRTLKHKKSAKLTTRLSKHRKLLPNVFPVEIKVLNTKDTNPAHGIVSWQFLDWLTYVTESINQTMQFENYGNINTLHFCTPKIFYDEIKAKRVPKIYTASEEFQVETYRIMNILHVKEIFDTAEVKLKISKRFYHDSEKGYVEYDENHGEESCQSDFIFFLNVGESTVDESDNINNPFLIQWISPNYSTISKVGQLKLQYKYGRKHTA